MLSEVFKQDVTSLSLSVSLVIQISFSQGMQLFILQVENRTTVFSFFYFVFFYGPLEL